MVLHGPWPELAYGDNDTETVKHMDGIRANFRMGKIQPEPLVLYVVHVELASQASPDMRPGHADSKYDSKQDLYDVSDQA